MLFNSLDYILFLGIAVAGFWLLARHAQLRIIFVFVASCLFYMAWHPAYIVLILGSTLVDYIVGLRIHATDRPKARKRWLILSLVSNLGLLGLFKYFNFASQATADVLGLFFGIEIASPPFLDVLLPVGISFYTFQTLSYTIDIYRRKLEPTRNFFQFAFFVTYFPQLVAGPIVRASQLLPQLQRKITLRDEQVTQGLFLIASGMVKKVVIADYLSVNLVDRVFDQPELYSAAEIVIALYGFTMQIYCDFSGYTDVARGSAKLMGLELPENFDRPYQSASPAEFWRRWHITLSTWLRDYLYFPLGGSRVGPVRAYWNLWLTMFLIGIWHGASWTFVFYAILQSMAMVIHRFFYRRSGRTSDTVDTWRMHAFKVFWALQFVVFSRILFRATNLQNAADVTTRLASGTFSVAQISLGVWAMLLLTFAAHYTPKRWFESIELGFKSMPAPAQGVALAALGFVLSVVATSEVVPYIYFQF
ncbi:MAG: MBOAT family protein [Deltaproteobacteria bacterium]|nr:MAG: MBOAT family protein [Deltaproteobacteria bacterium]